MFFALPLRLQETTKRFQIQNIFFKFKIYFLMSLIPKYVTELKIYFLN